MTFRHLRIASQLLFLCIFLFLFRQTDYNGSDHIPYAVNIFFRWDPLVAFTVMVAKRAVILVFLPSLIVIGLTVVFGRVFCGWICPLGTLIDMSARWIKPLWKWRINKRPLKYMILAFVFGAAILGVQYIAFFDPFSILVRGLTFALDPLMNAVVTGFFDGIYTHLPSLVSNITEPVYTFLKETILPFKQTFFYLSGLSLLFLMFIFFLEKFERRFWCRNLCPLGALLSLLTRISFLRRVPFKSCSKCMACSLKCRMDAFEQEGRLMTEECNMCMDCMDFCPDKIVGFSFRKPVNRTKMNTSRRSLLKSALLGMGLPFVSGVNPAFNKEHPYLIRPPGALEEKDFLAVCVRCGECMKICIQNALQPVILEKGIECMFTPKLVPRFGYCEFNCTLCGQICPTGAIRKLNLPDKQKFVIGTASFDKNRCLPYDKGIPCIVCEEHCPVYDKAIKFKTVQSIDQKGNPVTLKKPYVVETLCIGCGICEKVCPLQGEAAVRVIAKSGQSEDGADDTGYGA
ncbi:MAG: 4Fe-4S binding protein [Proteobacteria bacterium]|nr:4Fe-4S binding protein [Pseudomonadota bacterium]